MTDHPILFSGPMVRAILAGRKTQTRRILRPIKGLTLGRVIDAGEGDGRYLRLARHQVREPRHAVGDRLWIREGWRVGAWDWNSSLIAVDYIDGPRRDWLEVSDPDMLWRLIDQSRADAGKAGIALHHSYHEYSWKPGESPCRWRPSIHMPRRASRLTLVVTDVRVQRLQSITLGDCYAEGCETGREAFEANALPKGWEGPWREFSQLWDGINGKRAEWASDPWVAAITFTAHRCNIDAMEDAA